MKTLVISNEQKQENVCLKEFSKWNMARLTDESLQVENWVSVEEFQMLMENQQAMDMVYMDVTRKGAVERTEDFRREHQEAPLLVIADGTISPMEYLKPTVQANSLLLRPFDEKMAKQVVADLWNWYHEQQGDPEKCFYVESQEENVRVRYDEIAYFESREKKVYVNLETTMYGFSDTMNRLETRLPEYFIRCHRSFIVNHRKIKNIAYAKGEVELDDNTVIPLSRSYKEKLKEWEGLHGKERYYL